MICIKIIYNSYTTMMQIVPYQCHIFIVHKDQSTWSNLVNMLGSSFDLWSYLKWVHNFCHPPTTLDVKQCIHT